VINEHQLAQNSQCEAIVPLFRLWKESGAASESQTHCHHSLRICQSRATSSQCWGQDTSASVAPVYDDRSLEEIAVLLELSQSFGGARSALDDTSNLVTTEVFEDVGELIACGGSFLDVCEAA
jgi:hypothetical protein